MSTEERVSFCDREPLTRVMDDRKDSPHPLPQAPNGLAPPSISSRRAIPLSHHYVTEYIEQYIEQYIDKFIG